MSSPKKSFNNIRDIDISRVSSERSSSKNNFYTLGELEEIAKFLQFEKIYKMSKKELVDKIIIFLENENRNSKEKIKKLNLNLNSNLKFKMTHSPSKNISEIVRESFSTTLLKILKSRQIESSTYLGSLTIPSTYATMQFRRGLYDGYTRLEEITFYGKDKNGEKFPVQKLGLRGFPIYEDGTQLHLPSISRDGDTESIYLDNPIGKTILFFDSDFKY